VRWTFGKLVEKTTDRVLKLKLREPISLAEEVSDSRLRDKNGMNKLKNDTLRPDALTKPNR